MVERGGGHQTPPRSCHDHGAVCDVAVHGTLVGAPVGTGTYEGVVHVTMTVAAARPNGRRGYCWPASGTLGLGSDDAKASLEERLGGSACQVGPNRPGAPLAIRGTYAVARGGGTLRAVAGGGRFALVARPGGAGTFEEHGRSTLRLT
jgi:hypothetical protein